MSQVNPVPPASAGPERNVEEKLGRLPPAALRSFREFLLTDDEKALTVLVLEVLTFHLPNRSALAPGLVWHDDTRLVEDLGFDSLATVETVFFFEDLFQISILNEEIVNLKTVGDLRRFLRSKVKGRNS